MAAQSFRNTMSRIRLVHLCVADDDKRCTEGSGCGCVKGAGSRKTPVILHNTKTISYKNEIESLKLLILKLGEPVWRVLKSWLTIGQLELRLEDLETNQAARGACCD
jgi:hypothetical protein